MSIDRDRIVHIARLARLELDAGETAQLERDLAQILGYVDKLRELDTEHVAPTAQVAVEAAPLRDDGVESGLAIEHALGEAPRRADRAFAVPAFLEES